MFTVRMRLTSLALIVLLFAVAYAHRGSRWDNFHQRRFGHSSTLHRQIERGPRMRNTNNRKFHPKHDFRTSFRGLHNDRHVPVPELYRNLNSIPILEDSRHSLQSPCMTVCPMSYIPVCGNNGRSYSNKCELDVAACRSRWIMKTLQQLHYC